MIRPWWWVSFADTSGFLGGCVIRGDNLWDAVRETKHRGCNPNRGEVVGFEIPEDKALLFPHAKLLDAEEIAELDRNISKGAKGE